MLAPFDPDPRRFDQNDDRPFDGDFDRPV